MKMKKKSKAIKGIKQAIKLVKKGLRGSEKHMKKVEKEPKYINNLKKKSRRKSGGEVIKKEMVYKKRDRGNFDGIEIVIPESFKFLGYCHFCEAMVTARDFIDYVSDYARVDETGMKYRCVSCDRVGKVEKLLKKIEIDREALGGAFEKVDDVILIEIPKEIEDSIKEE